MRRRVPTRLVWPLKAVHDLHGALGQNMVRKLMANLLRREARRAGAREKNEEKRELHIKLFHGSLVSRLRFSLGDPPKSRRPWRTGLSYVLFSVPSVVYSQGSLTAGHSSQDGWPMRQEPRERRRVPRLPPHAKARWARRGSGTARPTRSEARPARRWGQAWHRCGRMRGRVLRDFASSETAHRARPGIP